LERLIFEGPKRGRIDEGGGWLQRQSFVVGCSIGGPDIVAARDSHAEEEDTEYSAQERTNELHGLPTLGY
jgi:hypothetical protein